MLGFIHWIHPPFQQHHTLEKAKVNVRKSTKLSSDCDFASRIRRKLCWGRNTAPQQNLVFLVFFFLEITAIFRIGHLVFLGKRAPSLEWANSHSQSADVSVAFSIAHREAAFFGHRNNYWEIVTLSVMEVSLRVIVTSPAPANFPSLSAGANVRKPLSIFATLPLASNP